MNFIKNYLLIILPVLFFTVTPELSAKSHHRHSHHKRTTRTSLSFNMNVNTRTPAYYSAPIYYNPGYTTVVTQYQQPTYYEQVTVVRPAVPVVQQVIVQPQPQPTIGFSFSPFFSFWSR